MARLSLLTPPADHRAARHRAPALSPEERRLEIIAATLPLLREYGANVTTSQIAEAAGIAEGTIFRVFEDKRTLLLVTLRAAMSADVEVARIGDVPADLPLVERLVAALGAISDYQDRLWSLMRALQESGWRPGYDELEHADSPRRQMQRIAASIAVLFQTDTDCLRLDPLPAARMLLALAFSRRLQEDGLGEPSATAERLVDLFLYGALRAAGSTQPDDREGDA